MAHGSDIETYGLGGGPMQAKILPLRQRLNQEIAFHQGRIERAQKLLALLDSNPNLEEFQKLMEA